jgi:hypothetical protein
MERFSEYLHTMLNDRGDDVELMPLLTMNPMGREHVAERLDEWIGLGAEQVAAQAVAEAAGLTPPIDMKFKHGLVVADDVRGGWTNRYTTEAVRFQTATKDILKRPWMGTILWASQMPNLEHLRREVMTTVFRTEYMLNHEMPKTLRDVMAQEGYAMAMAGMSPHLDADDINYTCEVLQPYMESISYPVIFAAMYGDTAARLLGYEPLGLSERAGFALAVTTR